LPARPHGREAEGDRPFAAADARRRHAVRRDDPRARLASNLAASALSDLYNAKGVFNNRADDLESLSDGLRRRFANVAIAQEGCVAIFRAS